MSRREQDASPFAPIAWGGMATYLLLTFVLSWVPALALRGLWHAQGAPSIAHLLTASAAYAATMGWQPLAAALLVRRWFERHDPLDEGIRPAPPRFAFVAALVPLGLVLGSIAVAWLAGRVGAGVPQVLADAASAEPTAALSPGDSALLLLALLLTIGIIYGQSFSEELGWRGYFLARLMREIGPRLGLVVHGAVWGLWYAPPFLLATDQLSRGALRCAAFILTCTLLGTWLGWMRLASRSIMPAVIANAVLTLTGGLPFILQDVDVGLRGTTYGPWGWIPLLVVVAFLLLGRRRSAVAVPVREPALAVVSAFSLARRPRAERGPSKPN